MNDVICKKIITRAMYELQKSGVFTQTNFESAINGPVVKLYCQNESAGKEICAWIKVIADAPHLIILFGNLTTGENFARSVVKPENLTGKHWGRHNLRLSKEILNAINQREKLFNNSTPVSLGNNTWHIDYIGGQ